MRIVNRLIKGMPPWKYWSELRKKSKQPKRAKPIQKKKAKARPKIFGLKDWFIGKVNECLWICEECGANCFSTDADYQIACQAHLLPKEHFKSVATHPLNHKCLGSQCGCHSRYDKSWMSAQKMKVWPSAEEIILTKLIPALDDKDYKKLPAFLKEKYEEKTSPPTARCIY